MKTEPYSHNVGTCYRCHNDVEPLISAQWFVKMKPLAEEAIRVIKDGTIKFVPERFSKTYLNWMENVHDWCISRQLWWGHQIPAWYCDECGHINVSREDPTKCEKCGCTHLTREEDVLDTWFSSGLWPFSTLGWPDLDSEDLKYWYPTTDMVTGYDIIFFWVARMVVSGMEQMKKSRSRPSFIHGLVRDDKGRKNVKVTRQRHRPAGDGGKIRRRRAALQPDYRQLVPATICASMWKSARRCATLPNKIWNASRYVLMNLTIDEPGLPVMEDLELEDKWVLSKLNTLIREVTANLDAYEIGVASSKVYDFIWDTYCDWYIELTKTRLYSENERASLPRRRCWCMSSTRRSGCCTRSCRSSPRRSGRPFRTEGKFLISAEWPVYREEFAFGAEEVAHGADHRGDYRPARAPGRDERAR